MSNTEYVLLHHKIYCEWYQIYSADQARNLEVTRINISGTKFYEFIL